ncbi:condensation domain-containing protein [Tistrella bauzanensis]
MAKPAGVVEALTELVDQDLPLTPIQRGFLARNPELPPHWNQAVLLAVADGIGQQAIADALAALVARHDALRLRMVRTEDGRWHQRVVAVETAAPLLVAQEVGADGLQDACTAVQASLEPRHGPVVRGGLFHLPDGSRRLLIAVHHLAVDGVSWRVLAGDLDQMLGGDGAVLPPVPVPWSRWALAAGRPCRHSRRGWMVAGGPGRCSAMLCRWRRPGRSAA